MSEFSWGFCSGMAVSLIFLFVMTYILQPEQEFALDVYRGKTTLEITYRDSVAIDSTVVYKVRYMELVKGDCLVEMKNIPDKSIDMILCDLPYGTTACKWDVIIPFDKLWMQYKRVIKDNGVIALFGSQPFTSMLVTSNLDNYREELVWLKNKPASGLAYNKRHLKIHENIIIFSSSANYTYNPQKWLVDKKEFLTQRKTFKSNEYIGNNIYGKTTRTRKPDDGSRNPITLLSCRTPHNTSHSKDYTYKEIRFHPTQKPVALLEYLIKTYSNEGDTILDNTMGSGSTGVACVNTNRDFIGIELNEEYFKIAERRINEAIVEKESKLF